MNDTWIVSKLCHEEDGFVAGITLDNNGYVYFTNAGENIYRIHQDDINTKPQILFNIKGAYLRGIVWNRNNILYICDMLNDRIYSYSIDTGNLSILAGTGKQG